MSCCLLLKLGSHIFQNDLKQNGTQAKVPFFWHTYVTLFAHARGRLGFILFRVLALELGFHSSAVFRFSVICNSCLFVATPKMNYFCSI